jgi:plastocyanin
MSANGRAATSAGYGDVQVAKPTSALDALRTVGGGLEWPLGLRLLDPKGQSKELRDEIDDAMKTMFQQPGGTDTTIKLLQQVRDDVDKLDRLYKDRVWDMALTRQQEANVAKFVRKVRQALSAAEESAQLYRQSQLYGGGKGSEQGPREVGVYDSYFEPKSIEVSAGTQVRWKSYGKHRHTITADKDEIPGRQTGCLCRTRAGRRPCGAP